MTMLNWMYKDDYNDDFNYYPFQSNFSLQAYQLILII